MRYITVAEFRVQAEKQQIFGLVVHRFKGNHSLVLRLKWANEEHLVVTQHGGKPREWSSLDRLLAFLDREGVYVPDMVIKFNKE